MTRKTNARLAGFMFLFYVAVALPGSILFERATGATGIPAKLEGIAQQVPQVHLAIVLSLVTIFIAWTLAVTLYSITRDQDRDLAMLAMSCRLGEGVLAPIQTLPMLGLLWLATAGAEMAGPDAAAAYALGALLLKVRVWGYLLGATVFAVGSTLFSYLFLRARSIPLWLAWLGVFASVLLVVALPAQLVGLVKSPVDFYIWMPMLVFEVTLALWLLIKGVAPLPATSRP
jgi:hypothetical protein